MKIYIKYFTENGRQLAEKIRDSFKENDDYFFEIIENADAKGFAQKSFEENIPAVFIGAVGIAVRSISKWINNKLTDIPVIVIDEGGDFVIPLLSGHVGGANEIATAIAKSIDAVPVITTATDVNNDFAIDVFAKKNNLIIKNKEGIKEVSKRVLNGHPISILLPVENLPADVVIENMGKEESHALLHLAPKPFSVGIGCKKGKSPEEIKDFLEEILEKNDILPEEIFAISSIDLKAKEEGLLALSRANRIPFMTFSAESLKALNGEFSSSEFVEDVTGIDCVCERAAIKACKDGGVLIQKKTAKNGITIAIAKRNWRLDVE